ncbi:MAG: exopolysaccharide biosynthesis polyprenyl glycosylphosphotransferase [Phycisphaerales bacterium]|nr:exopolysaccharide biosynthesis polyprenyl glycosylphosphotransferase [Phycisphaerales bacterium]
MSSQAIAGADGSAGAAPSVGRLIPQPVAADAISFGSVGRRALRLLGRTLVNLPPSTWLLVDVTLLFVGIAIAYAVFPPFEIPDIPHVALWQAAAVLAFAGIIASLVFGLYERETIRSRSRILTRMLLTVATTAVISYTVIYVIMYATVSRRAEFLALAFFLVTGTSVRFGAWWAVRKMHRGLLVVGSRGLFESFVAAQKEGFLHEYKLIGYASTGGRPDDALSDPFFLGAIASRIPNLRRQRVTEIVVGNGAARDPGAMDWMVPCLQAGCRVTNETIFYETATGQILVDEITPNWFLFADLKVHCDERATLKRLLDLTTAFVALCLTAPLWPIIALAIKLCDAGPVFYSQDRVGQNGQIFRLHKFRTMRTDAENGKSVWATPNDPRATLVGRWLRRSRLDELPQLYNVLVGQMSLVGPRPERPDIVRELCDKLPYYGERHLVKPGVTGWAQISFRYGASIEDAKRKLQFDLYYLKHMSFELDTIILFRTLGTFLRGGC